MNPQEKIPLFWNIFLLFTALFVGAFGIWGIILRKGCTAQVNADLIRISCRKGYYSPVVRYTYHGTKYEVSTIDSLPKRKMTHIQSKDALTVYVNPRRPSVSVVNRSSYLGDFGVIFYALACLLLFYALNFT